MLILARMGQAPTPWVRLKSLDLGYRPSRDTGGEPKACRPACVSLKQGRGKKVE